MEITFVSQRRRKFQYRKRYEITCDCVLLFQHDVGELFQYRKRYEITCDSEWKFIECF